MKITDYQKVQTLDESNIVLIDGNNGTKTIMVTDFIKSLIGLTSSQDFISGVNLSELTQINTLSADDKLLIGTAAGNKAIGADDALFAILDAFVPKEQRRMIYRGKNLGSVITDDQKANIKNGTELGMEAKKYMDQGQLVPDELTVKILLDRVAQDDCKNGYVLDGFPRTIPQAEVLDKALTELGDAIDFAIDVNVPDENIVKRMSGRRACLSCGATYHIEHIPPKKEGICDKCGQELVLRDDDKPETVLNRLKVYHDQPLIDFYTKKNVLKTVDGTKDMKEVFADIVAILG